MPPAAVFVLIVVAVLLLFLLVNGIKIVQEYERGVIFRLGRCVGAKGPGIFFIIPIVEKYVRVSLQTNAVQIPVQQVITSDSVSLKVDAFAYMSVVDPVKAVNQVTNWYAAAQSVAQTSLQTVIGHHQLDELLTSRDRIAEQLRTTLDEQTEAWGVRVERVELRDIDLPEQIQRAMGRQAEAERERRAKIVAAEGELQASEKLAEAAAAITRVPGAMQLRTLQTLSEISTENNSTILFPIELLERLQARP